MAIRKLKPDTPSRRYMSVSTFDEITKKHPERSLTRPLKKEAETTWKNKSPQSSKHLPKNYRKSTKMGRKWGPKGVKKD